MSITWSIAVIAAISLGLLLVVALLIYPENERQNRLLALVIALALVTQGLVAVIAQDIAFDHPVLVRLDFPSALLTIAFLYLYIRSLTTGRAAFDHHSWRHLAPFAAGVCWCLLVFLLEEHRRAVAGPALELERWGRSLLLLLVQGGYVIAAIRLVMRYERQLSDFSARPDEVRVRWLRLLLAVVLLLLIVHAVDVAIGPGNHLVLVERLSLVAALSAIGIFSLRYSRVFSEVAKSRSGAESVRGASANELEQWKARLLDLFESERPHLDAGLRLGTVAARLRLKPYQVSELLRRGLQSNFFDYVNQRRVEEAKRKLRDPALAHLSILGIALESGFNSKSSFAVAFKRWTGTTPSAYRQQQ